MDLIFHEKQEGSLCAQHCLNALLQGPYFTPVDLAELAQRLDESERQHMAEGGFGTQEYQQFIAQPSSNYDDSGFFSIQVLQQALSVWNLELVPFNSSLPICRTVREDPRSAQAYVCNFREHWLTIRHIGNQWFNLNSLLTGPELLSDTYLSLFLTQLQHEGYSIFVVVGELPPCEANDMLMLIPAVQPIKPRLITDTKESRHGMSEPRSRLASEDDAELRQALAASRRLDEEQDESLKRALELSMLGLESSSDTSIHAAQVTPQSAPVVEPSVEELRRRRLAYLDKGETGVGAEAPSESPQSPRAESSSSEVHQSVNPSVSSEEKKPADNRTDGSG